MNGELKKLNVLIIEDSEDDVLLILRALRNGGFEAEYKHVESPAEVKRALSDKSWYCAITTCRNLWAQKPYA